MSSTSLGESLLRQQGSDVESESLLRSQRSAVVSESLLRPQRSDVEPEDRMVKKAGAAWRGHRIAIFLPHFIFILIFFLIWFGPTDSDKTTKTTPTSVGADDYFTYNCSHIDNYIQNVSTVPDVFYLYEYNGNGGKTPTIYYKQSKPPQIKEITSASCLQSKIKNAWIDSSSTHKKYILDFQDESNLILYKGDGSYYYIKRNHYIFGNGDKTPFKFNCILIKYDSSECNVDVSESKYAVIIPHSDNNVVEDCKLDKAYVCKSKNNINNCENIDSSFIGIDIDTVVLWENLVLGIPFILLILFPPVLLLYMKVWSTGEAAVPGDPHPRASGVGAGGESELDVVAAEGPQSHTPAPQPDVGSDEW